ncbi:phosphate acyltransferase [Marinicella litoralis]|uniref:Phosphate acyltransferase n=1 Tax=Marinicella litoralis TaxID=644220 RepID=A0A4R6XEY1_9GAMM|nr:phosphate acyltransferase [Marinicella litoralis]TDR16310.1 phosphate:acyl-[acyl carrier protein] acyltransferase [Marinicella litoralis]
MNDKKPVIAIDLMGGDDDPLSRLRAIKSFLLKEKSFKINLFVNQDFYKYQSKHFANLPANMAVIQSEHSISMDESPLVALRKKRNSSLSMAIKAVADNQADVILSAGNSGALVAFAKYWLKPNAPIERPALATVLPGFPKPTLLLDIGATLEYRAEDLYALAELGAEIAPQLLACGNHPEVALLNVGTEHIKGHDTVQQADRLLQNSELNYLGFCEGTHLFKGYADVICCDGFVGNIALKACEGLAQQLQLKQPLNWWQKLFCQFNDVNFNPAQYNGALLLGLDGLVVKAHGNSNESDFHHALIRTAEYIKKIN